MDCWNDLAQPVPADAWLDDLDSDLADVDIIEHCEPVAEWGGVISLLWVPERAASRLAFAGTRR